MSWAFGLCDLSGASIGRLHWATERKLTLPLNGLEIASVTLRLDDPLADEVLSRVGDVLLKVYQDSTLCFVGECTLVEELGAGGFYRRVIDRQGLLNDAYSLPADPTTDTVRNASDADSIATRGLFEEVVPSDVQDSQLRQALVDAHVRVRKVPREIITFDPTAKSDTVGTVALNFAGPLWRLQKRLIGVPYPFALAAFTTPTAANEIIDFFISQTNQNRDTGIRLGTRDALYDTTVGGETTWALKPIGEALTEMQDAKVPFPTDSPPTFSAQDTFSAGVHGSAINGRTDNLGNTWTSGGSGPDWTLQAAQGLAYRTSSNDGGAAWAFSDAPAHGAVLAGMDHTMTGRSAAGLLINYHLYARLANGVGHPVSTGTPGSGQWVRVVINYDTEGGSVQLEKRVGGVITQLGTYSYSGTWIEEAVWYAVRLLVDDDGNYTVWHFAPSSWPAVSPVLTGRDADLASTGTVASGVLAWGDINISGVNHQRSFDNIFASTYTGAQSFDFELAPVEPTADTNQDGVIGAGLQIADLNLRYQIGTVKPSAIFEPGRTPTFGSDYAVGDFVTGRAKDQATNTERFNAEFRVYAVEVTIDEEGKEAVIPTLVPE